MGYMSDRLRQLFNRCPNLGRFLFDWERDVVLLRKESWLAENPSATDRYAC